MPRPKNSVPTYSLHRPSGQAVVKVTLPDGSRQTKYLGPFGSPESKAAYAAEIARLEAPAPLHPSIPAAATPATLSLNELMLAFMQHAAGYFRRPDGSHTKEVANHKMALRPVKLLFGDTPVARFGPRELKQVRDWMVRADWCRTQINKHIGRIRGVVKWGVSEGLVTDHPSLATPALYPLLLTPPRGSSMPVPFAAYYSLALRRSAEDGLLQYAAPPRWFGEPGVSHGRLDQWLGNRMQRRLAANKVVHRDPGTGDIHVQLHQTNVVTAHPDGGYTVRTGGWHTPTTRRTIQYLTGLPVRSDGRGGSLIGGHPLREGMRVPHDLPSDQPAEAAVTTPADHPDLQALYGATVGGRGQDNTAGRALADWLQNRGDWRHHLFASPLPEGVEVDYKDGETVSHGQPGSESRVWFHPQGAVVATALGGSGEHHALLSPELYHALRTEAATAGVHFPRPPLD